MRKLIILPVLLLLTIAAMAQTSVNLSGKVLSDGAPVVKATVSLLKAADSSLVKLAVTTADGGYEFVNIKSGDYLLAATYVGFAKAWSKPFTAGQDVTVPDIVLSQKATDMTAITVQAKRPLVEARLDKMIVNVDASPTNSGATALELLEKSPGISVDRDGNISLKGKQGVIVLMDGKQTYLSGQDLANLLRNMPASQLDQVEIMTQPSAKFDAAGNSGIINLRTKKNRQTGFNGAVNLSYVQGVYPKSPNSFSFNYRKGKVNLFTTAGITYWEDFNKQTLFRRFRNTAVPTVFDQAGRAHNISTNYNARIGLDYTVDKKTTLGFLVGGIYGLRKSKNNSAGDFYREGSTTVDSTSIADNSQRNTFKNFSANINYKRTLSAAGHELTADLDYIRYHTELDQYNDNHVSYPAKASTPYLLRAVLPTQIAIYSGKIDYTHPLSKEAKLEAGLKSSLVKTDNNAPYETYNAAQGKWVDDVRKDHFAYDENIAAAYINYSRQIKKWGLQTGLRAEHTHSVGRQVLIGKSITRNYLQLFPTAYASYAMNDRNQFALSYGRRIERPNYQDLNPFQQFLDLYTYNQGNPYLSPQFTHNIELSHVWASKLSTTLNYTSTTDIINDILKQNDETKVTFQTKENVAGRRNIGVAISYNAAVNKWWTTSLYANLANNHYSGIVNGVSLTKAVTGLMLNFNQQFRFAKTWGAEVSGFYSTKALATGMFVIDPMGVISFGASKQVLKNKGSLKLQVRDPFLLQRVNVHINHSNIDMLVTNFNDNRRVGLSFTYRFSKGQAVQQRRRSGSATEEQNRVGGGN